MLHPLSKISLLIHVISVDFAYIHWKAAGEDFDKIHRLAETWYITNSAMEDTLAEIAMEENIPVFNPNDWMKYIPEYEIETADSYSTFLQTVAIIQHKLELLIDALLVARKVLDNEDMKSQIDDYLRKIRKETNYKLEQTLSAPAKLPINFVVTGLDNRVSAY